MVTWAQEKRLHPLITTSLAFLFLVAVVGSILFALWGLTPMRATPEAIRAMSSDPDVQVARRPYGWVFTPRGLEPATGIVIYPETRIQPQAYSILAKELARAGIRVAILSVRLNVPAIDTDAAARAIGDRPDLPWIIAGHGGGGTAAARFAARRPDLASGLALLGAHPDERTDLSDSSMPAVIVTGSLDGLVRLSTVTASLRRLPADTPLIVIEGGDHSQFGSFGLQPGDLRPVIAPPLQRAQTVSAIQTLAERIGAGVQ